MFKFLVTLVYNNNGVTTQLRETIYDNATVGKHFLKI